VVYEVLAMISIEWPVEFLAFFCINLISSVTYSSVDYSLLG
jgi:hypothetical protein